MHEYAIAQRPLIGMSEHSQGVGKQALSHNSMTARVAPPDTIGLASGESLSGGRADALAWRRVAILFDRSNSSDVCQTAGSH